jgi:hypothetical protein
MEPGMVQDEHRAPSVQGKNQNKTWLTLTLRCSAFSKNLVATVAQVKFFSPAGAENGTFLHVESVGDAHTIAQPHET